MAIRNLGLLVFLFCFSCTPAKKEAEVQQIRGMHVYVLSSPAKDYEKLGVIDKNNLKDYEESIQAKRTGSLIQNIFNVAAENSDIKSHLIEMVIMARDEFPGAEGIVFDNKLSKGTVVSFQ